MSKEQSEQEHKVNLARLDKIVHDANALNEAVTAQYFETLLRSDAILQAWRKKELDNRG